MRIGLLGGTFDPIHFGHLRAAEEVLESLALDEIWLVPAFLPPHKEPGKITPFHHRLAMAELAVSMQTHFKVSDMEAKRKGRSYTIDTLKALEKIHGKEHEFFFIVGMDAFLEIDTWKSYKELPDFSSLVVIKRDQGEWDDVKRKIASVYNEYKYDASRGGYFSGNGHGIYLLTLTSLAISSTRIREKKSQGLSINYLAPKEVIKYMEVKGLYKKEISDAAPDYLPDDKEKAGASPLAMRIAKELSDNKGEDILILDVRGVSAFTDYFVISHGRSQRHAKGMAENLKEALKKEGIRCSNIEGEQEGNWILMDYGDVIIHIFYEPVRSFYDIEGLWIQAPRLKFSKEKVT